MVLGVSHDAATQSPDLFVLWQSSGRYSGRSGSAGARPLGSRVIEFDDTDSQAVGPASGPQAEQARVNATGLRGDPVDAVCWVWSRFHYRGDSSSVFRTRHTTVQGREAEWNRVLIENAHLLPQ